MTATLDRIRGALVGLKMPRALEALDHTMQKLGQGENSGIEALDALLSEEFATQETRRQIESASYRLRDHTDLIPEHTRTNLPITPSPPPKRRGRPPKNGAASPCTG